MSKKKKKDIQRNDDQTINLGAPDYTKDFEEIFFEISEGCLDDNEMRNVFFTCALSNVNHDIFELRTQIKNAHYLGQEIFNQTGKTDVFDTCYSPAYAEEQLHRALKYKEFLENKRKSLIKSTRLISNKEKYQILFELDFFNLRSWVEIGSNDRETLLAEIFQCDIDTARHLVNGTADYRMKPSKASTVKARIENMKKGV